MALSYSNTVSGNGLVQPNGAGGLSTSAIANGNLKNLGGGISINPAGLVAPKQPTVNSASGPSTAPVVTGPSSTSLGSYKGIAITPGSDSDVANQISKIDAGNGTSSAGGSTPGIPALPPPPGGSTSGESTTGTSGSTSTTPTFSGLVGTLADYAKGAGATPVGGATSTGGGPLIANPVTMQTPVQQANNALTQFRVAQNQQQANIYGEPGLASYKQGEAAAVQQANAQTEAALETGVQNALTGQGQQITAASSAAGLAVPQVTAPGQAVFNPVTGTYTSASSGGGTPTTAPSGIEQNSWNQYIQDYSTGNFGAIPSSITGNPNLSGQLQQAVQAGNPGFNYNAALGAGQATQSNAQTSGTAATNTAAAGYSQAVQTYNQTNTAYNAADQQAQNLQSILSTSGINSADSTDYNKAINSLQGRFSSPQYSQFVTALTELQNMYSQILSAGGTPSGSEAQALAVLNPNSSASAINASIGALQQAAYTRLNSQYQQAQTYQSNLNGGSGTATSSAGASGANPWH